MQKILEISQVSGYFNFQGGTKVMFCGSKNVLSPKTTMILTSFPVGIPCFSHALPLSRGKSDSRPFKKKNVATNEFSIRFFFKLELNYNIIIMVFCFGYKYLLYDDFVCLMDIKKGH